MLRIALSKLVAGPFVALSVLAMTGAVLSLNSLGIGAAAQQPDRAALNRLVTEAGAVVVARARSVQSAWHENEHGDRIIESSILLDVAETLKGRPDRARWLRLQGGTVDGITLEVSGEPELQPGDRAVFFLTDAVGGPDRLASDAESLLLLDERDFVRGTGLGLDEIRQRARGAGR